MIGCWLLDSQYSWKLETTEHVDDAPPGALRHIFFYQAGDVQKHCTDYITKERLASRTSHRALHDQCMGSEATRVGQMLYALKQQRAQIYEIKTDSVLYRPSRRSDKTLLASLCYDNMAKLRDICEKVTGMRRLNERHALPEYSSRDPVFRVAQAAEEDPMKMHPSVPRRNTLLQLSLIHI